MSMKTADQSYIKSQFRRPIYKVPALAKALDLDLGYLLVVAMRGYSPELADVIDEMLVATAVSGDHPSFREKSSRAPGLKRAEGAELLMSSSQPYDKNLLRDRELCAFLHNILAKRKYLLRDSLSSLLRHQQNAKVGQRFRSISKFLGTFVKALMADPRVADNTRTTVPRQRSPAFCRDENRREVGGADLHVQRGVTGIAGDCYRRERWV